MMQEINLYQPIFRKEKPALHAVMLGYITLALVLALISLGMTLTQQVEKQELAYKKQVEAKEQVLEQYNLMVANAKPIEKDPSLIGVIDLLKTEKMAKQSLIGRLAEKNIGTKEGFSNFLIGFARNVTQGLWLREIEFTEGGSNFLIRGALTQAKLLPKWLVKLSTETSMLGKEFGFVEIRTTPNTESLSFTVATTKPSSDKTSAENWLNNRRDTAQKIREAQAELPQ